MRTIERYGATTQPCRHSMAIERQSNRRSDSTRLSPRPQLEIPYPTREFRSRICRLPLHVRALLGHLVTANQEHVDAANVTAIPAVEPPLHHAIAGGEDLLLFELRVGVVEDRLPGGSDG